MDRKRIKESTIGCSDKFDSTKHIINQVKWQSKNKDTTQANNYTLKREDGKNFT